MAAARRVKEDGEDNDLIERIAADPLFGLTKDELAGLLDPKEFTGRSASQVEEFITGVVKPILDSCAGELGMKSEISV